MATDTVHYAYTDGSSLGNPGPAGWAVLFDDKLHYGEIEHCTNNYAEMFAVKQAIDLALPNSKLYIFTDSKLVIGWFNGFAINVEAIREVKKESDQEIRAKNLEIAFLKVKGHAQDESNIRVDRAARACATNLQRRGPSVPRMTFQT